MTDAQSGLDPLALGGSRSRIIGQLMVEALLLSGLGAAAGIVIAWWTMNLLAASLSLSLPIAITVDASPDIGVLGATAAFAVVSTLVFALGPAWSLSKTALASDMKLDDCVYLRPWRRNE